MKTTNRANGFTPANPLKSLLVMASRGKQRGRANMVLGLIGGEKESCVWRGVRQVHGVVGDV